MRNFLLGKGTDGIGKDELAPFTHALVYRLVEKLPRNINLVSFALTGAFLSSSIEYQIYSQLQADLRMISYIETEQPYDCSVSLECSVAL